MARALLRSRCRLWLAPLICCYPPVPHCPLYAPVLYSAFAKHQLINGVNCRTLPARYFVFKLRNVVTSYGQPPPGVSLGARRPSSRKGPFVAPSLSSGSFLRRGGLPLRCRPLGRRRRATEVVPWGTRLQLQVLHVWRAPGITCVVCSTLSLPLLVFFSLRTAFWYCF